MSKRNVLPADKYVPNCSISLLRNSAKMVCDQKKKKKPTKKQVEILPRAKNHIRYFFHTSGFIWYFSDMVTSWKTKATKVKLDHQPAPNSIALYPDPQIHIQTDLLKQINNTLWHCNLSTAVLLIEPLSKADLNTGTYSQVYHFYNNDSLAYVA